MPMTHATAFCFAALMPLAEPLDLSHRLCRRGCLIGIGAALSSAQQPASAAETRLNRYPGMPLESADELGLGRPTAEMAKAMLSGVDATLTIPTFFYRSNKPVSTGQYSDVIFLAADYASGRTATVTRTRVADLLADAGIDDVFGTVGSLADVGKPAFLATLLAGRRDGDPRNSRASPASEVLRVERRGDALQFALLQTPSTVTAFSTASTRAAPTARIVQARSLLVRRGRGGGDSYLLTAWASSTSRAGTYTCETVPCTRCEDESMPSSAKLTCECPPPRCTVVAADDALDIAIVESLTLE